MEFQSPVATDLRVVKVTIMSTWNSVRTNAACEWIHWICVHLVSVVVVYIWCNGQSCIVGAKSMLVKGYGFALSSKSRLFCTSVRSEHHTGPCGPVECMMVCAWCSIRMTVIISVSFDCCWYLSSSMNMCHCLSVWNQVSFGISQSFAPLLFTIACGGKHSSNSLAFLGGIIIMSRRSDWHKCSGDWHSKTLTWSLAIPCSARFSSVDVLFVHQQLSLYAS